MDERMLLIAKTMLPGFPPHLRPLLLMLLHILELQTLLFHFQEDNRLLQKEVAPLNMEEIFSQILGKEGADMMEQAKQFMDMMEMMNFSQEDPQDGTL